jgi:hypothetical protein
MKISQLIKKNNMKISPLDYAICFLHAVKFHVHQLLFSIQSIISCSMYKFKIQKLEI